MSEKQFFVFILNNYNLLTKIAKFQTMKNYQNILYF